MAFVTNVINPPVSLYNKNVEDLKHGKVYSKIIWYTVYTVWSFFFFFFFILRRQY